MTNPGEIESPVVGVAPDHPERVAEGPDGPMPLLHAFLTSQSVKADKPGGSQCPMASFLLAS